MLPSISQSLNLSISLSFSFSLSGARTRSLSLGGFSLHWKEQGASDVIDDENRHMQLCSAVATHTRTHTHTHARARAHTHTHTERETSAELRYPVFDTSYFLKRFSTVFFFSISDVGARVRASGQQRARLHACIHTYTAHTVTRVRIHSCVHVHAYKCMHAYEATARHAVRVLECTARMYNTPTYASQPVRTSVPGPMHTQRYGIPAQNLPRCKSMSLRFLPGFLALLLGAAFCPACNMPGKFDA